MFKIEFLGGSSASQEFYFETVEDKILTVRVTRVLATPLRKRNHGYRLCSYYL